MSENQVSIGPRGRTAAYIEMADALPRMPGKCQHAGCDEDLVGFCAGDVDNSSTKAIDASIRAWFRFGCPEHDIHVEEWVGDHEALAALRHQDDPEFDWAPAAWRPALARTGWGLRTPSYMAPWPKLRFGSCSGRVWVTDGKTLIAMPEGTSLDAVEDAFGLKVTAHNKQESARRTAELRAERRLTAEQIGAHLSRAGYRLVTDARRPSELGWPEHWDHVSIAMGESVIPIYVRDLVRVVYPDALWSVRGKLDAVKVSLTSGQVVAVIQPADVAATEAQMAADAKAEKEMAGACPVCSHQHAGKSLGYICIGCACTRRPSTTNAGAEA